MMEQFYLTLTGNTNTSETGPRSNSNEGVPHIPQTPGLEPYHQMQFSVIFGNE